MNKLLVAVLATSLVLGANESFASQEIATENNSELGQTTQVLEEVLSLIHI